MHTIHGGALFHEQASDGVNEALEKLVRAGDEIYVSHI